MNKALELAAWLEDKAADTKAQAGGSNYITDKLRDAAAELRRLAAENVTLNNEVWKRINQYNELDGAAERMSERISELEAERDELAAKLVELERWEIVPIELSTETIRAFVESTQGDSTQPAPIPAPVAHDCSPVADEREAFEAWLPEIDTDPDYCDFSRNEFGYYSDWNVQRAYAGWAAGVQWQARATLQPATIPAPVADVPLAEQACFCGDEISLQMASGGGAPEGLYGRVTLMINGEYVDYVRRDSFPIPAPVADEREAFEAAWIGYTYVDMRQCAEYFWQARADLQPAKNFDDVIAIQRAEAERDPSDAYMVGLYNGMAMMNANYKNATEWYCMKVAQPAQPAAVPGGWHMVCGDWRDELVALHDGRGHIVSGLTADQARALIAAHGGGVVFAAAPIPAPVADEREAFDKAMEDLFSDFPYTGRRLDGPDLLKLCQAFRAARQPAQSAQHAVIGMKVSIDLSTDDADATNRAFGTVYAVQGDVILAESGYLNFAQPSKTGDVGASATVPEGWREVKHAVDAWLDHVAAAPQPGNKES